MKILFLTVGEFDVASSRSRVFQYLPFLISKNIQHKILIFNISNFYGYRLYIHKIYVLAQLLRYSLFFDIVFVQKVLLHPLYFKVLKSFNSNIVFDFDDAIYTVCKNDENELKKIKQNEKRFAFTVKHSKLIILENAVAKAKAFLFNQKILQITGPIDTSRYNRVNPKHKGGRIVIGWIGSPYTTHYLHSVRSVLERVIAKYPNVFFKTIGASDSFSISTNYIHVNWDLSSEVKDLEEFDIGIMPLPDDEYAKCKGGYKLLQYMSMGIPSVASPVGINKKLIVDGINGFLATNEDQWYKRLIYLIENIGIADGYGKNARLIAEDKFSYEINAPVWLRNILDIINE